MFNKVVQQQFPNENSLTSFLGIFFSLTDIFTVLFGLFLFKKINEKFGVIVSLLLLPLFVGLSITFVYFANIINLAWFGIIFAGVVIARLLDESIRSSINDQVILLLFQPLKTHIKYWAQNKIETWVTPLSTGLIGIIVLCYSELYPLTISSLSFKIILFCVVSGVVLIFVKEKFIDALKISMKEHNIMHLDFSLIDKTTLNFLKNMLKSKNETEIIFALTIFEKQGKEIFVHKLKSTLNRGDKNLHKYTLEKIIEYQIKNFKTYIFNVLETISDPDIKSLAIIDLGVLETEKSELILLDYFHQKDPVTFKSAMIGLLRFNSQRNLDAMQCLIELVRSVTDADRKLAA